MGDLPYSIIDLDREGVEPVSDGWLPDNSTVLVLGLGRSGAAACELLLSRGHRVVPFDDDVRRFKSMVDSLQLDLCDGSETLLAVLEKFDPVLAVVSPGIPPHAASARLLSEKSVHVISELELAWRFCETPCVVVTGTNGKSTTTTLVTEMLSRTGQRALAVGNIGVPFSQVVARAEKLPHWYVVEASSYQLALADTLHPRVMVYTNFAPDHLDWHGGQAAYVDAKAAVSRLLGPEDHVVVAVDAGPLLDAVLDTKAKIVRVGSFVQGADIELDVAAGVVRNSQGESFALHDKLKDLAYSWRLISCALQACLGVAQALAIPLDTVVKSLYAFRPLEHRLEEVGAVAGVRFINDSKATNVDATGYALRMCVGPIILILGGRDKGVSYRELLPGFAQKVRAVVALGEARDKIVNDLSGAIEVQSADSFSDALERAYQCGIGLGEGATVLLSPACSSFDMFSNFEERGCAFKSWVDERRGDMA